MRATSNNGIIRAMRIREKRRLSCKEAGEESLHPPLPPVVHDDDYFTREEDKKKRESNLAIPIVSLALKINFSPTRESAVSRNYKHPRFPPL